MWEPFNPPGSYAALGPIGLAVHGWTTDPAFRDGCATHPRQRQGPHGAGLIEPGGGMVPGPWTSHSSVLVGCASSSGWSSFGGCAKAGVLRSSMSSMLWALASRQVMAGRFHFVSTSAQMLA